MEAQEDDPGVGLIKLEEMVVVGDSGAEVYTRMPIEDLLVASPSSQGEAESVEQKSKPVAAVDLGMINPDKRKG